jgi:hypothetical protein
MKAVLIGRVVKMFWLSNSFNPKIVDIASRVGKGRLSPQRETISRKQLLSAAIVVLASELALETPWLPLPEHVISFFGQVHRAIT